MKKKTGTILLVSGLVISFLLLLCGLILRKSLKPKTYSAAKAECVDFLEDNQKELEQIASELLEEGKGGSGYYQNRYYCFTTENGYVKFDVDAQGMLGGQYWELVYTRSGRYYGNNETYLYQEEKGNNIVRGEHLGGHWWYRWTDYDGTDLSFE